MARFARVMLAGWPFHLTHRGNHRKHVFRGNADRRSYLAHLQRFAEKFGMSVWAYCLMGNHVHLIAVGARRDSIWKAIGYTHRTHSRSRNREAGVTGHLWANRFHSTALDEPHLWAAVRYVELNPVRAGLVNRAIDYAWSSARAHADRAHDPVLDPKRPFPGHIGDWEAWLDSGLEEQSARLLRANTSTGHPTGCDRFVRELEQRLGRELCRKKRGPMTNPST